MTGERLDLNGEKESLRRKTLEKRALTLFQRIHDYIINY